MSSVSCPVCKVDGSTGNHRMDCQWREYLVVPAVTIFDWGKLTDFRDPLDRPLPDERPARLTNDLINAFLRAHQGMRLLPRKS